MPNILKKILKRLVAAIVALAVSIGVLLAFFTIVEYKPEDVETITIEKSESTQSDDVQSKKLETNKEISILTWNTGYGALGKGSESFLDGGKFFAGVEEELANQYYSGIQASLKNINADIEILQEVDYCSSRSNNKNQTEDYNLGNGAYARNFKCLFTPYPAEISGTIDSGIFTTSSYDIEYATRYSLPCPFSWPSRTLNLKRCYSASYFTVKDTDKKLVVVNFHLDVYDDGEGKVAQTKQLMDFIKSESDKGNWVIAGGDWNQTLPGTRDLYPSAHEAEWSVGKLETTDLIDGFTWAYNTNAPTCRHLNQPYNPSDTDGTQVYVIDGFVISDNISLVSVENQDYNFENSDHNPVLMKFVLN